jgi:hypothetical protein
LVNSAAPEQSVQLCRMRQLLCVWSIPQITITFGKSVRKKVKVKSLCLTNEALRHKCVWRSGCIDPRCLDIGTSWRWVVSFTARPLCPRGKSPQYPLDRRFGEPQSRPGRHGEVKILTPAGTRPPTPRSSSP